MHKKAGGCVLQVEIGEGFRCGTGRHRAREEKTTTARCVYGVQGTFAIGESLCGEWSCCMRAISGIGYAYQPDRYGRIPTHDGQNDAMIEGAACMQPGIVPGRVEPPRKLS
jgi:hypothetical protein